MIGSLGVPELIFILVLVLLVFGPKRLPEIGRTLGKGLSEFRRASNDLKRTINAELALEEEARPAVPAVPAVRIEPPSEPEGTEARPALNLTEPVPDAPAAVEPAAPEPAEPAVAQAAAGDARPIEPS